jgi:hypothetical protein
VARPPERDDVTGSVPRRHRPEHTEPDLHRADHLLERTAQSVAMVLIGCSSSPAKLATDRAPTEGTSMPPTIDGFDHDRIPVAEGVSLHAAVAGSGHPIVLRHGFPQTHLMWRHVAVDLATDHTVICPDLRGYGAGDGPAANDASTYAKRTMTADVVALARALGHRRFALVGHDRGALVALRAGLDHPDTVTHLACLDVLRPSTCGRRCAARPRRWASTST